MSVGDQPATDLPGTGMPATGVPTGGAGARTDPDPYVVTRSEEELRVVNVRRAHTRVRVRKVIVTEQRTITTEVRREELRVEQLPVTADDPPMPADVVDAIRHPVEGYVYTLSEEEVVVERRVVPRERVRLVVDTVTEQRQLTRELRKEQVDVQTVGDAVRGDARKGDTVRGDTVA